jgi:hypothetical protein
MNLKNMFVLSLALLAVSAGNICFSGIELPNGSFDKNAKAGVSGWQLDGRPGNYAAGVGVKNSNALSLRIGDDGKNPGQWRSDILPFKPGGVYGFRFKARSEKASGGTLTTGTDFANVDVGVPGLEWKQYGYCFVAPLNPGAKHYVKFGLWNCTGDFFIDDVELFEVEPVYSHESGFVLGSEERIDGNLYCFNGDFGAYSRNHSRNLSGSTASFNSQRWCLGAGGYIDYKHSLEGHRLLSGSITVDCGYYHSGAMQVLVSEDQKSWKVLGELSALGSKSFDLPKQMLPAATVFVRLAGKKDGCNLQVYDYHLECRIDGAPLEMRGYTRYVEKITESEKLQVVVKSASFDAERQSGVVELKLDNKSGAALSQSVSLNCVNPLTGQSSGFTKKFELSAAGTDTLSIPFEVPGTGDWSVRISVGDMYASRFSLTVPPFFDSSYGELLPSKNKDIALWQASSGWKISRGRRLPQKMSKGLEIKLAANESESVQLVLRAEKDLHGIAVKATDLKCNGRSLPAGSVEIDVVGYVPVKQPTDATGVIADWPDPIFPQKTPCELKEGENHPFWVRVTLPKGVKAGAYTGHINISGKGVAEQVPLLVNVFGFELPDRMSCETAFGMNHNRICQYHRLKTETQRREVVAKYLKCLSDYKISPYDPAPLDRWTVEFKGLPAWRGGEYIKGDAAEGEWSYKVTDNSEKSNVNASYADPIKLTGKALKVSFSHKSLKPQRILFTMTYSRADGSWISGNNRDIWLDGTTEWKHEEVVVKRFPKEAASFRLSLWGAGYYEGKSSLGTTWYDDIVIAEQASGKVLFDDGDFEREKLGDLSVEFDWEAWDLQMEKAFNEYHFTTFRCRIQGLGGGTFMSRSEPNIAGVHEGDEAYAFLLEKYLKGVEQHLKEKGWLKHAYIYWFDEPSPKDYEFVMNGFAKLKRYAPELRRMLTEQVEPELIGGPNLWCPLTPKLNVEGLEERRKAGDEFWWYLCCSPKAPYTTIFIDHPGVELRLWLWQTWAERVTGILVWESVYWHSSCAYPDSVQNPYEDSMGWVNHVDKGVRKPWGNGDGRFVYPPLSAAAAGSKGPVTEGPVPSVRLEMLRDGLGDYEYFVILKKLLAERGSKLNAQASKEMESLLKVPKNVSKSLTEFNTDPAAIERHREKIARAIEVLTKLK